MLFRRYIDFITDIPFQSLNFKNSNILRGCFYLNKENVRHVKEILDKLEYVTCDWNLVSNVNITEVVGKGPSREPEKISFLSSTCHDYGFTKVCIFIRGINNTFVDEKIIPQLAKILKYRRLDDEYLQFRLDFRGWTFVIVKDRDETIPKGIEKLEHFPLKKMNEEYRKKCPNSEDLVKSQKEQLIHEVLDIIETIKSPKKDEIRQKAQEIMWGFQSNYEGNDDEIIAVMK